MPSVVDLVGGAPAFDAIVARFDYLSERWKAERGHEDFNEYSKAMQAALPDDVILLKLHKRPFRVDFMVAGEQCFLICKGRQIIWGKVRCPTA